MYSNLLKLLEKLYRCYVITFGAISIADKEVRQTQDSEAI